MMKRATLILSVLVLVISSGGQTKAGPITYTLDDRPSLQSNYHIVGTITTDGTIGSIKASDITAWSLEILNPSSTKILGSVSSTGLYSKTVIGPGVIASANGITIDTSNSQSGITIGTFVAPETYYELTSIGVTGHIGSAGTYPGPGGWIESGTVPATVEYAHVSPSTAVPEPSTLGLLSMAGLSLAGYRWRRRTLPPTA